MLRRMYWNEYIVQWTSQLNNSATMLYLVIFTYVSRAHLHIFMTMSIKKALIETYFSLFVYRLIYFSLSLSLHLSHWFVYLRPRFYWKSPQFTYQNLQQCEHVGNEWISDHEKNKTNWSVFFRNTIYENENNRCPWWWWWWWRQNVWIMAVIRLYNWIPI